MKNDIKGLCKFEEIKRVLEEKLLANEYVEGEKLPSIRQLSEKYKLNKATVNLAINSLVADGFLRVERGRGTFVCGIASLKKNKGTAPINARLVGVLVPSVATQFYPGIVRGAEDVCRQNGYNILLGNSDADYKKEKEYMASFANEGAAGFIIAPSMNSHMNSYYGTLMRKGMPIVFTDSIIEGFEGDLVATDNFKAASDGARMLTEHGCKKIACVTGPVSAPGTRERIFGFKIALSEAGIDVPEELTREAQYKDCSSGYRAAKELLSDNEIDGLFCSSEALATDVLRAASEFRGNRKLKLATFSDTEQYPGFESNIVLIIQRRLEIGRTAGEMLFQRLAEKNKGESSIYKKILLEAKIVDLIKNS